MKNNHRWQILNSGPNVDLNFPVDVSMNHKRMRGCLYGSQNKGRMSLWITKQRADVSMNHNRKAGCLYEARKKGRMSL